MSRRLPTRRDAIRATALSGAVLLGAGSATVSGEIDSDSDATISYDEERLERYQPLMSLSLDARDKLTGVYGYVAEYDDEDVDVLCYWSRYAVQEGISWIPWDSHQYDHEPVYLFVDESGDVEELAYTGYHHYVAREEDPDLEEVRADEPTHISLDVVSPWHHYRIGETGSGAFYDVRDWTSARSEWEEYGFYEGTSRAAVDDPIVMRDRSSWWEDGSLDARLSSIRLLLGLDPTDRDELEID